jgi:hypothetical protein
MAPVSSCTTTSSCVVCDAQSKRQMEKRTGRQLIRQGIFLKKWWRTKEGPQTPPARFLARLARKDLILPPTYRLAEAARGALWRLAQRLLQPRRRLRVVELDALDAACVRERARDSGETAGNDYKRAKQTTKHARSPKGPIRPLNCPPNRPRRLPCPPVTSLPTARPRNPPR